MDIKPVKNARDHDMALKAIDHLMSKKLTRKEEAELEVLGILVETYEEEHFPIAAPSPVDAIKFRMEQLGLKQVDVGRIIGSTSRVSEILSGKRSLTLPMIRSLSVELGIPTDVLVQEQVA
jgi:HTH-type transcriptional regulator / antitoxin HigA